MFPQFIILVLSISTQLWVLNSKELTIYEILKSHGLPTGLLPKGIQDFSYDDDTGKFEVHLDQPCNSKFENELHYEKDVSGILRDGEIDELSGISAQDLFLWFPVKEIRVDIPSSGVIYFDVGVVSKQFSLSSFETPRDCVAVESPAFQSIVKGQSRKFIQEFADHQDSAAAAL